MRNNGRYTAAEENISLGAHELFDITDSCAVHKNVDFPGHKHASFYDANKVEVEVRSLLDKMGIEVLVNTRAVDVVVNSDNEIEAIKKALKDLKGSYALGIIFIPGSYALVSHFTVD